jgi:hypothetical protein
LSGSSPLGKITWIKFRGAFELAPGVRVAQGLTEEKMLCTLQPTR